jgi:hypothetical protein
MKIYENPMAQSKLKPPEKGPTSGQDPEFKPHVVPKMADLNYIPQKPRVWKVSQSDTEEVGKWLIPKLKETYPRLSIDGVNSWIVSAMNERNCLFIRTPSIFGLFYIDYNAFDPAFPTMTEKFVRARVKNNDEAIDLYMHARDYGLSVRVSKFTFGIDSNCFNSQVVPMLGDLKKNCWAPERANVFTLVVGKASK